MSKFRIGVLGIGGVGGYFGGMIAARFAGSDEVETNFIARGANAAAIRDRGLKIVTRDGESIVHPDIVAEEPDSIGEVDLLIVATKAYDLEDGIAKYSSLIGPRTSVLPLLNGVGHADTISRIFPNADVWNGCVFIVARLESPGTVRVDSDIRLFQFGSASADREKPERFLKVLVDAGIDAMLVDDIEKTVWEKFIFISPLATLTTFLDTTIGGILETETNQEMLIGLIAEAAALARSKRIAVADDIEASTLERIRRAPPASTSSMHSDFKKGGRTEVETLTGYVVAEAAKIGVQTPVYRRIYDSLK